MRDRAMILALFLSIPMVAGCMSPQGKTREEQNASALEMRDKVVKMMIEDDEEISAQIEKSVGYATFSNFSIHPGMISFATGYGVITNKQKERNTHLKWHRLTLGPGLAVKGLYALVVFYDQELMENFEDGKWTAGGQAEASLVFGDFGGDLVLGWLFNRKMDLHYITHTGVALELELIGIGRVSENSKLNEAPAP